MSKKLACGISGLTLLGILAINHEYQDFKKRNEYFPFPKVNIEIVKESYILPKINYSIDARTGEVETILQEIPDKYFAKVTASIDKKFLNMDNIFNQPKLESLTLYIKGEDNESIITSISNENIIISEDREIPLDQDYKIYAKAIYSNDKTKTTITGVDKSAINLYKVK